jgi:hypothetical protein
MSGQHGTQDHTRTAQKHFAQKKKHDGFAREQEKARIMQLEKTERLRALRLAKEASEAADADQIAK